MAILCMQSPGMGGVHHTVQLVRWSCVTFGTMSVCSVCQNDCSGHGTCNQRTKKCSCDVFWMENFFKSNFGPQRSNCGELGRNTVYNYVVGIMQALGVNNIL